MKIKLTKKKNSLSLRFAAESGAEGIDLKDIVLAAAKKKKGLTAEGAIAEFKARGYSGGITKETRNTKEFRVGRAQAEPLEPEE